MLSSTILMHRLAIFKAIKILLLNTFLLLLVPNISNAQNKKEKKPGKPNVLEKFSFGVFGGLSLNRFTKEQPQTGFNTGFTGGASLNYQVYKQLGLQLEVNFLQQGGQLIRFKDDTRIGLPESFETKNVKNSSYLLNSVEVPLLLNYTFKIKQAWSPILYTGASYAYNFNVVENYQKTGDLLAGEDIIATVNGSQYVTSLFNRSRFNFVAGATVKLPLYSNFKLVLDFRYLVGLTTARGNYSYMDKAGFGSDVRINSFVSRIGVVLPLTKATNLTNNQSQNKN